MQLPQGSKIGQDICTCILSLKVTWFKGINNSANMRLTAKKLAASNYCIKEVE